MPASVLPGLLRGPRAGVFGGTFFGDLLSFIILLQCRCRIQG